MRVGAKYLAIAEQLKEREISEKMMKQLLVNITDLKFAAFGCVADYCQNGGTCDDVQGRALCRYMYIHSTLTSLFSQFPSNAC